MLKLTIKTIVFSILFTIVVKVLLDPIFKKHSNFEKSITGFYELDKDSLDILFLGSSHARNTFNPSIVDKALNVKSYNLGSGGQRIMVTNNLLKDILKHEAKPKLIILDAFPGSLDFPIEPGQKSNQLEVLDNTKWSLNKTELMFGMYNISELPAALSFTVRNHDKWATANWKLKPKNINDTDVLFVKGFSGSYTTIDDKERSTVLDYNSKKRRYLSLNKKNVNDSIFRKELEEVKQTIDLCKRHNVELLIVSAPYFNAFYNPQGSNFHNLVNNLCKKNGVRFLDFNAHFDDMRLNLNDFRDKFHVNVSGSDKVTKYLVKYLSDKNYFAPKSQDYLKRSLQSISNAFKLVYKANIHTEIFPGVFVENLRISKNKNLFQVVLKLNKYDGVDELLRQYNLEYQSKVEGSIKKIETIYNPKVVSIDGKSLIIFRVPSYSVSDLQDISVFSFLEGKKTTSQDYNINLKGISLKDALNSDDVLFDNQNQEPEKKEKIVYEREAVSLDDVRMGFKIKQKRFANDSIVISPETKDKLGFLKYKTDKLDYSSYLLKLTVKGSLEIINKLKFRSAKAYDFDDIFKDENNNFVLCKSLSSTINVSKDKDGNSFSSIGVGFNEGDLLSTDKFTILKMELVKTNLDCIEASLYPLEEQSENGKKN